MGDSTLFDCDEFSTKVDEVLLDFGVVVGLEGGGIMIAF
jgi:hypothetical protein